MSEPSDNELEILKVFWRDGDRSAREVHDALGVQGWAPSTTRTVLERMRAKGLLVRRSVHGVAVYTPAQSKVAVLSGLFRRLGALLDFDGALPAAAFAGSQLLDAADIAALDAALKSTVPESET